MAIVIVPEIFGQEVTSTCTYCYIYEPLKIKVSNNDLTVEKLYMDLIVYGTDDGVIKETKIKYAIFDISPDVDIHIDLMGLTQQYHDADTYIYASTYNVTEQFTGWHSVVSKYKYKFSFYTDVDESTKFEVFKLPIIGGRSFKDFVPAVSSSQALTEATLHGVDLSGRWINYPLITTTLASPTATDSTPTITNVIQTEGCVPEGFIIFKSRFGGWMTWGFDINVETISGSYSGQIESTMFESTTGGGGTGLPYVPVDYIGVTSDTKHSLKALSLLTNELRGASGIHASPAVYYMKDNSTMELMRKTGASTPISSLATGGDFTVSLKSISSTIIKTK